MNKKLLKSLKTGMKQANEGKVVKRDFSEFSPKPKKKTKPKKKVGCLCDKLMPQLYK